MRSSFLFIVLLISFASCYQTTKTFSSHTVKDDLIMLLQKGRHQVEIMDSTHKNPREIQLNNKMLSSINGINSDWFHGYLTLLPPGVDFNNIPYDPHLGLSSEEYKELLSYYGTSEFISSGKETITIYRKNEIISFKSQKKLEAINSLTINLKKLQVKYGDVNIDSLSKVNITNETGAFRSKLNGYQWYFEQPDLNRSNAYHFELLVWRVEKTGKTLLCMYNYKIKNDRWNDVSSIQILF